MLSLSYAKEDHESLPLQRAFNWKHPLCSKKQLLTSTEKIMQTGFDSNWTHVLPILSSVHCSASQCRFKGERLAAHKHTKRDRLLQWPVEKKPLHPFFGVCCSLPATGLKKETSTVCTIHDNFTEEFELLSTTTKFQGRVTQRDDQWQSSPVRKSFLFVGGHVWKMTFLFHSFYHHFSFVCSPCLFYE